MSTNIQAVFDAFCEAAKAEALVDKPIITLGELIAKLENQNPEAELGVQFHENICAFDELASYRGYYSDLSIEPVSARGGTVGDALKELRAAVGKSFYGYKGGDYVMNGRTLVWVSQHGTCSGLGVTGVESIGGIVVITSADCEA